MVTVTLISSSKFEPSRINGAESVSWENENVVYDKPYLTPKNEHRILYSAHEDNHLPEREQRLNSFRVVSFVANEEVFTIMDLTILTLEVGVRRDILYAHGKREAQTAARVDRPIDDVRKSVANFVT